MDTNQDMELLLEEEHATQAVSSGQLVMRRFLRNKLAIVGVLVLLLMTVFCFLGPVIGSYSEYELFYSVNKGFTPDELRVLIERGTIDENTKVNALYMADNITTTSAIIKARVEKPSNELYTVAQALSGEIPAGINQLNKFRLYQVSLTDAENKAMQAEGLFTSQTVQSLSYAPPSAKHWLGTDKDGFDVLTRLMYGGRISLLIGVVCMIIEILIGMTLGGMAGYFGGIIDGTIMRIVDIFNSLPTLPIIILLNSYMRQIKLDNEKLKLFFLIGVIGILSWPGVARMVRGQILSLREQEFMVATEASGLTPMRRIFRHLLPNVMPQMIVSATLSVGAVILLESTLSYLGLGVSIPYATWGGMIQGIKDRVDMLNGLSTWVSSGLAILMTVMAINFVGDGLRDAFDPKMKR